MTTAAPATAAATPSLPAPGHRPAFSHLLAAEWTKIRSVRSTVWTIISFTAVTIGLTGLLMWATDATWNDPHTAARNAGLIADPVGRMLDGPLYFGQLVLGVLGVLVISSEYSTGVIRASLLAVPRRLHMLAAKLVVFAALTFVIAELVSFCSFFVGSAILHAHVPVSLGDRNVVRAIIGTGLYLVVIGLFSLAIGSLIRHTAGGIATVVGILFLVPILGGLLPGSWGAHINAYLPEQAGAVVGQTTALSGQLLSAWDGFGVFCLWTAVLLGFAAYLLRRRDA